PAHLGGDDLGQVLGRVGKHRPFAGQGKMICVHGDTPLVVRSRTVLRQNDFAAGLSAQKQFDTKLLSEKKTDLSRHKIVTNTWFSSECSGAMAGAVNATGWDRPARRRRPPAFENQGTTFGTAARGGW